MFCEILWLNVLWKDWLIKRCALTKLMRRHSNFVMTSDAIISANFTFYIVKIEITEIAQSYGIIDIRRHSIWKSFTRLLFSFMSSNDIAYLSSPVIQNPIEIRHSLLFSSLKRKIQSKTVFMLLLGSEKSEKKILPLIEPSLKILYKDPIIRSYIFKTESMFTYISYTGVCTSTCTDIDINDVIYNYTIRLEALKKSVIWAVYEGVIWYSILQVE